MALEALPVVLLVAVVSLVAGSLAPPAGTSLLPVLAVLASATAVPASVAALLAVVVPRLGGDRRLRAVGWPLGCYAVVVLPLSSVDVTVGDPRQWSAVFDAATVVFLSWFALATWRSPRRPGQLIALGALVAALAVLGAARVEVVAGLDTADLLVTLGWPLLACRCIARGLRRAEPVWWRTGLGLGVLAVGQLLAVLRTPSDAAVLQFSVLRLLGFLVIAVELARYSRSVVRDRRQRDAERAEQAAMAAQEEAQRSHEIRNALSNLSAITSLLGEDEERAPNRVQVIDPGSINEIISSEFARLHNLLESASTAHDDAGTPVDRVLTRLVTLRRLTGSSITLSCPSGLVTAAPPATLAQVVTNLLANCDRHAPGAEVHVTAWTTPGACVIEVTDAGPGLRALQGQTATTGSGLGLELSSQLAHEFGGTLHLMPATRFPTGTTARLCLPLVGTSDEDRPYPRRTADLESVS